MNKVTTSLGVLVLSLALAPAAWAVTIDDPSAGALDGTDVGGVDIFHGETDDPGAADDGMGGTCGPGGSPAVEECWAESVLGIDLVFDDSKTENVTAYATDTANVIAFQLSFGGGFYIVKNGPWYAIIENVADLDWGVIDITDFDEGFNLDAGGLVISHVTEFNGGTSVPEPGSLALLGLGLLGLGLARRYRR